MFAGVPCAYDGYRPMTDDSRGVLYIAPLHTMAPGFVIKRWILPSWQGAAQKLGKMA
jgi:hypothetical protein